MTKTTTKKFLGTIAALALMSSTAFANVDRDVNIDKMFYTINPSIPLNGPVYKDNSSAEEKGKYASELMRIILKEAHSQAKSYLEAGDTQAYYAALTLALTVPLHEGLYVQFRNVNGTDACNAEANSGDLVFKSGETNYGIFRQFFKDPSRTFFPNCENISGNNVTQIIRGGDGTDLSVMQVSIRWHIDDFLAIRAYEDVSKTVKYGVTHLMNGFNPVYRNIREYKCIASGGGFSFFKKKPLTINYVNLIRGIWAGQYNSGSILKTCRFDEFSSPYKNHDRGFERNVNKFLNFNGSTIMADLIATFTLDQDVASAVSEVVGNLKNNTNNRSSLSNVLGK